MNSKKRQPGRVAGPHRHHQQNASKEERGNYNSKNLTFNFFHTPNNNFLDKLAVSFLTMTHTASSIITMLFTLFLKNSRELLCYYTVCISSDNGNKFVEISDVQKVRLFSVLLLPLYFRSAFASAAPGYRSTSFISYVIIASLPRKFG